MYFPSEMDIYLFKISEQTSIELLKNNSLFDEKNITVTVNVWKSENHQKIT